MHLGKLLFFVLVVGGLAAAVVWQTRAEDAAAQVGKPEPLLAGFDVNRVQRFRIDNLERGLQLEIVSDGGAGWRIVDPIDYPASAPVMEHLVGALRDGLGPPVETDDLEKLSLAPPRVVLEVEELVGGEPLLRRIEVGVVDFDKDRVHVREGGRVLRIARTLDTVLERDLFAWRSLRITTVPPRRALELHRSGDLAFEADGESMDLTFDAVFEDRWRATAPESVALDPEAFRVFLANVCNLQASGFVDDAPTDLALFGLDPAPFVLRIDSLDGPQTIRMAPGGPDSWYCVREGHPHVFEVAMPRALVLTTPPIGLYDRTLVRAVRDTVERVELEWEGRTTTLERHGDGRWTVEVVRGPSGLVLARTPADPDRAQDVLGLLERTKILEWLPGVDFDEASALGAFHVEAGGGRQGGVLGPEHTTPEGARGYLFRRDGDGLCGLLDFELAAQLAADANELRSRVLHKVKELDVARIELSAGGATKAFVRQPNGRWSLMGTESEARAFTPLVDRLLSLRAAAFLAPQGPLEEAVTVRVLPRAGAPIGYEIGADAEGTVYARGEVRARVDGDLHGGLLAALGVSAGD